MDTQDIDSLKKTNAALLLALRAIRQSIAHTIGKFDSTQEAGTRMTPLGINGLRKAVKLLDKHAAPPSDMECIDMACGGCISGDGACMYDSPTAANAVRLDERDLLDMAVDAGLWPNTIQHWMPALQRYTNAVLARSPAAEKAGGLTEAIRHIRLSLMLTTNIEQRDHLAAALDALKRSPAAVGAGDLTAAGRDVLAERQRQKEAEGWTAERDDKYTENELAQAAAAYAIINDPRMQPGWIPGNWPWSLDWWKPTTPRRNLVKAGALIVAEIERLDRSTANGAADQKGGAA